MALWNKNKKEQTGTAAGNESTSAQSFAALSTARRAKSSVQEWAKVSRNLLSEIDSTYSTWQGGASGEATYNDVQTRLSTLLASANDWRARYAGDAKTVSQINDVVAALDKAKAYASGRRDYYGQWESAEAYDWQKKVNEINSMSAAELEKRLGDTDPVAYVSADGGNVTWQSLYDNKKLSEGSSAQLAAAKADPAWRTLVEDGNGRAGSVSWFGAKVGENKVASYRGEVGTALSVSSLRGGGAADEEISLARAMTQDEADLYGYLLAKDGRGTADAYFDSLRGVLGERVSGKGQEVAAEVADEHPVLASLTSVVSSLGSGAELLNDTARAAKTGEMDRNHLADVTATMRGTVSDKVNWEIGNWDAFDFLYNTAMSGADSLTAGSMFGGAGGVALGLGAAAQGVNDALDRGMSDGQAFWNGLSAGVFEGLFETVSLGQFNGLKEGAVYGIKDIAKNVAKSMLVNASEETATELANIIYDTLANRDLSHAATSIRAYMERGMSEAEAKRRVALELGAIGSVYSGARQNAEVQEIHGDGAQELIARGLESPEGSESHALAVKYLSKLNSGRELSGAELNRLVRANEKQFAREKAADETVPQERSDEGQRAESGAEGTAPISAEEYIRLAEAAQVAQGADTSAGRPLVDRVQNEAQTGTADVAAASETVAREASSEIAPGVDADVAEMFYSDESESGQGDAAGDEPTLEQVSKAYGAQAGAMVHTYAQGQDVEAYDRAYRAAYDMGRAGVSLSYAVQSNLTAYLSESQRGLAWEAGRAAADMDASAQDAANRQAVNGKTGHRRGVVRGEGVTLAELKESFHDTQNTAYKLFSTFAEVTGVDIVLYRSEVGEDGKFRGAQGKFKWSEDTVYVDVNAGLSYARDMNDVAKYTMVRTFAHEFTHFLEKWNPVRYQEFRRVVFDTMTERGEDVGELIEHKMAQDSTGKMTYEEASREVVAEAMTDILPDANFVQVLAERHKSIFDKLLEKLREFAGELKRYYRTIGANRSREAKALKEQVGDGVRYVENIVKLFDRAVLEAVENYQRTVAVEETTEDVVETAESVSDVGESVNKERVQEQSREYFDGEPEDLRSNMSEEERAAGKATADFIVSVANMVDRSKMSKRKLKIGVISDIHAEMIEDLVKTIGKDFSVDGYELWIDGTCADHIHRRHGENGKADHSMASREAKELIPWAANHPDTGELIRDDHGKIQLSNRYRNADGTHAYQIRLHKKINRDTLYVAECVPDGSAKRVYITGAYIKKGSTNQVLNLNSNEFRQPTPEAVFDRGATDDSIAQSGDFVNTQHVGYQEQGQVGTVTHADREKQEQHRSDPAHRKYSYEWFTSKPDMVVTVVDDTVYYDGKVGRTQLVDTAVAKAGEIGTVNREGNAVIHVADSDTDVIVSKSGLRHSMDRRMNIIAPVVLEVGDILKNAIRINELNPRADEIRSTYALIGIAKNKKNEPYIVSFVVNRYSGELTDMDVLYAVNAKKEPAGLIDPSLSVSDTGYFTDSDISIAHLLDFVNDYFPDILPEDILKHYGHDSRPDGVLGKDALYQQRTDTLTDREILAMAASELEGELGDLTDGERDALRIFRERLGRLEDLQGERLDEGRLYREQQFGADGTKVDRTAAEATRNRMKILDDRIRRASNELLNAEDKDILRRILERARGVIETREREQARETLRKWREGRENAYLVQTYRKALRREVSQLTRWIVHPNKKDVVQHVPEVIREAVVPFLASIDLSGSQALRGGEATVADKKFMKNLRALKAAFRENIDVQGAYSGYADLPPGFMENLQSFIDDVQDLTDANVGEYVVQRMSAQEMERLLEVVRTLKKYITEMNVFHANAMYQHVREAGDDTIKTLKLLKADMGATGGVDNYILWQQIRPVYAFERFGAGGVAIYDGLRRGQAQLAWNTQQIKDFAEKAYTPEEVRAWEKEILTVDLGGGKTLRMPVANIMSFYELSKRPQALGHILGMGVRVATFKAGKEKIVDIGHRLTEEDVGRLIGALTPRQKEVADALQRYMSVQSGEWGNHVSMKRFGEKLFGEERYFPIHTDGRHLQATADEHPSAASLYALLNMGFTKEVQEEAKNRILLYSIFDVFANHMASMAQYNAMALPVLDALKWFNYKQESVNENGVKTFGGSVREEMARVYGSPEESRPGKGAQSYAESFMTGILRAFNGTEAQGVPTDTAGINFNRRYNMAQVAFNLRVVVQQPLAITRAGLLIDYRSILEGMGVSHLQMRRNIEEMRKYSGIAAWKSLGFYDTNISRGLTEIIKHSHTVSDRIGEAGMYFAEKADTMTWAAIWSACKKEVTRKRGMKPGDEGFYDAAAKIFEDVIYKTQVVDSVLTKNEFLRSKGAFARLIGSFMSEPTAASMLIDAYDKYHLDRRRGMTRQQAWNQNKRMIGRAAYVYSLGAVSLAAVQAVADALRDDDDYQTFLEKWLEAFGGNAIDELMPLNKLPIAADFYDLAKELISVLGVDTYGNPPQSVFMQWWDSLVGGTEILYDKIAGEDTNYTWYGGIYKMLQALSGMSGLPMASATREIVTLWNNAIGAMAPSLKVKTHETGEMSQIKYAYIDGYLTAGEAVTRLLGQGLADIEEEAMRTVYGWEADGSVYAKIYDAALDGGDVEAVLDEMVAHGYTEREVRSRLCSQIGTWYRDGEISKQRATELLKKHGGIDDDEITTKVNKWSCAVVTGIAYDEIDDEYLAGRISATRAIEMYMRYGGMTREDAHKKVQKLAKK